jgi:hypothetical protein
MYLTRPNNLLITLWYHYFRLQFVLSLMKRRFVFTCSLGCLIRDSDRIRIQTMKIFSQVSLMKNGKKEVTKSITICNGGGWYKYKTKSINILNN